MSGVARAFGAAPLAVIALALLAVGGPAALDAYHARRPVVSACGADLPSLPAGTWVTLEDCAVDKFRASALRDHRSKLVSRLVPLRASEYDLAEPSGVALALSPLGTIVRFSSHPDDQLFAMQDQLGVVIGAIDALDATHEGLTDLESGLAPGAVVIEERTPPESQRPLTMVAGGGVLLVLAAWVLMRRQGEASTAAGVRWGLVAVLLIVSLAASLRALQWYFDPMRSTDQATARAVRRPPARGVKRPATAATAARPDPTPDEITALESIDSLERLRGADLLANRAVTPELVAAVDRALAANPNEDLTHKLVCLKSSFPGPDSLEFLLERFPSERRPLNWNLAPDVKCALDALALRVREDPLRVRDALVPGAFSDNGAVRATVQEAFRRIDLALPPMAILRALSSDDPVEYRNGLRAALALGAMRHNRGAVERAARSSDRAERGLVRHDLINDPHANAARIVAKGLIDDPDGEPRQLALEREMAQRDVSAALLEALTDPATPETTRERAVRAMIRLNEIGVLPEIEALRPTLPPGIVRDAIDAAIVHFDPHRRRRPRMRALTP